MPAYPPAASSGAPLASKTYNPGSTTVIGPAAYANLDATNLVLTVVAPASGKIIITLAAQVTARANLSMSWGLAEGGTPITATQQTALYNVATTIVARTVCHCVITGLTPGSSHTYTWQSLGAGSDTNYGGTAGAAVMIAVAG